MTTVLTPVGLFDDVVVPSGSDVSDAPAWIPPLQALANRAQFVSDTGTLMTNWANFYWLQVDVQEFTTSGTWTRPADASNIIACLVVTVDGGGEGGNGSTLGGANSGGHSGAYRHYWARPNALPSTASVVVGVGGTGATGNNSPGDPGELTYVDNAALSFKALAGEFGLGGGNALVDLHDVAVLLRTFQTGATPGGAGSVGGGCAPGIANLDTAVGGAGAGGFIDNRVKLTGATDGRDGGRGYGAGGGGGNALTSIGGLAGSSGYCSIISFYIGTVPTP